MKELPLSFRKNKYDYKLIASHDSAAIYFQELDGKPVGFEVHKLRYAKKEKAFNGIIVKKIGDIILPCDREWGKFGWTYPLISKAVEKFEEIMLNTKEND